MKCECHPLLLSLPPTTFTTLLRPSTTYFFSTVALKTPKLLLTFEKTVWSGDSRSPSFSFQFPRVPLNSLKYSSSRWIITNLYGFKPISGTSTHSPLRLDLSPDFLPDIYI